MEKRGTKLCDTFPQYNKLAVAAFGKSIMAS